MNHIPAHLPEILNRNISGYHQYCLCGNARPVFISDNLCAMLKLPASAIYDEFEDRYSQRIYPADREKYQQFLEEMHRKPQTGTTQYRLLCGDGSILFVCDTMTSYQQGTNMLADSVLTDITRIKEENQNLQYLNDTTPCGFLKYTCEKNPRVTYINDRMLDILGFSKDPDSEYDDLSLYMSNIYTLIPPDQRGRFSRYLERVYEQGIPIAGEMAALKRDGSRIYVFGWVTKCVNEHGEEEFQSAFIDITQRYQQKKEQETSRYLKALTEVYDKVFEFDLRERTVKCLYGQNSPSFKWLENIPMQMQEATEKWITGSAAQADQDRLRNFFGEFYQQRLAGQEGRPPQITYRALSSSGSYQTYHGVFLLLDRDTSLYCCRRAAQLPEQTGMQELAMRFTEVSWLLRWNRTRSSLCISARMSAPSLDMTGKNGWRWRRRSLQSGSLLPKAASATPR